MPTATGAAMAWPPRRGPRRRAVPRAAGLPVRAGGRRQFGRIEPGAGARTRGGSAAGCYPRAVRLLDVLPAAVYRVLRVFVRVAVRSYFRRIEVLKPDRVPARGPLLVVANHPASIADVLLLGVALPRRLHFLAHSGLFRPWPRGLLLRLFGALPVYRREDEPERVVHNDDTFRACHELFARGGAVAVFPEGVSVTDREVLPLKTGAARLALGEEERRPGQLALVPVGLHLAERSAFRSDVVVSVGRPLDLAPFAMQAATDGEGAVRALTLELQNSIARRILRVPDAALSELVRDIERIYMEDLRGALPATADFALSRGLAASVEHFRTTDPTRLYRLWRRVAAYRERLEHLGLTDPALRHPPAPSVVRESLRLLVAGSFVAVGLAPGAVLNVVPYRASGVLADLFAPDVTYLAFARIAVGAVVFPGWYALLAAVLFWGLHWPAEWVAGVIVAGAPLGFLALACRGWLRREQQRLRLARLATGHREVFARLLVERRRLVRFLDEARADYLRAVEAGHATPARAPATATARRTRDDFAPEDGP